MTHALRTPRTPNDADKVIIIPHTIYIKSDIVPTGLNRGGVTVFNGQWCLQPRQFRVFMRLYMVTLPSIGSHHHALLCTSFRGSNISTIVAGTVYVGENSARWHTLRVRCAVIKRSSLCQQNPLNNVNDCINALDQHRCLLADTVTLSSRHAWSLLTSVHMDQFCGSNTRL